MINTAERQQQTQHEGWGQASEGGERTKDRMLFNQVWGED